MEMKRWVADWKNDRRPWVWARVMWTLLPIPCKFSFPTNQTLDMIYMLAHFPIPTPVSTTQMPHAGEKKG
jgi:hypothetical protein